jgi:hypothetical protein
VMRFERSPLRVGPHEPRVASHISGKDRGQLGFDPLGRHSKTPLPLVIDPYSNHRKMFNRAVGPRCSAGRDELFG